MPYLTNVMNYNSSLKNVQVIDTGANMSFQTKTHEDWPYLPKSALY